MHRQNVSACWRTIFVENYGNVLLNGQITLHYVSLNYLLIWSAKCKILRYSFSIFISIVSILIFTMSKFIVLYANFHVLHVSLHAYCLSYQISFLLRRFSYFFTVLAYMFPSGDFSFPVLILSVSCHSTYLLLQNSCIGCQKWIGQFCSTLWVVSYSAFIHICYVSFHIY